MNPGSIARAVVAAVGAGIDAYRQARDEIRVATQPTDPGPEPPAFPDRAWRQDGP